MSEIRIERSHRLGFMKARQLAREWALEVERRFGSACTVVEGDAGDVIEFTRSGISGRLRVRADRFEVEAELGFLFSAFSQRIEGEIAQQIDALLAKEAAQAGRPSPESTASTPSVRSRPPASRPLKRDSLEERGQSLDEASRPGRLTHYFSDSTSST